MIFDINTIINICFCIVMTISVLVLIGWRETMKYFTNPESRDFSLIMILIPIVVIITSSITPQDYDMEIVFKSTMLVIPFVSLFLSQHWKKMNFPNKLDGDQLIYLFGFSGFVILFSVILISVKAYFIGLPGPNSAISDPVFRKMVIQQAIVIPILFIIYAVKYAPKRVERMLKEEKMEEIEKERLAQRQANAYRAENISRKVYPKSSSSTKSRFSDYYPTDDDINSVDGGPPSEAYDDDDDDG